MTKVTKHTLSLSHFVRSLFYFDQHQFAVSLSLRSFDVNLSLLPQSIAIKQRDHWQIGKGGENTQTAIISMCFL